MLIFGVFNPYRAFRVVMLYNVEIANITSSFDIDTIDTVLGTDDENMSELIMYVIIAVSCAAGLLIVGVSIYCICK